MLTWHNIPQTFEQEQPLEEMGERVALDVSVGEVVCSLDSPVSISGCRYAWIVQQHPNARTREIPTTPATIIVLKFGVPTVESASM